MRRYYLQLRDSAEETLDPDGTECADLATLKSAVLYNARDVIAGDVKNGVVDLRFRIDAEDENGVLIHSLPFTEAVSVIGAV